MAAYPSNKALINAINHANMSNGEVIIKLQGEVITGHIQNISMEMGANKVTTFRIDGVLKS